MLTDPQRKLITQQLGIDDLTFAEAVDRIDKLEEANLYPPIPDHESLITGDWQDPNTYLKIWQPVQNEVSSANGVETHASNRIPVGIEFWVPWVNFCERVIMPTYSHPDYICADVSRASVALFKRAYPDLKGYPIGVIDGQLSNIGHARNIILYYNNATEKLLKVAFFDLTPRSEFGDPKPPLGIFTKDDYWHWKYIEHVEL